MRNCAVCGNEFTHTTPGRPPVTCSPACHKVLRARWARASRERTMLRKCPPEMHGKSTGYFNYKCPCDECLDWARDDQRKRRNATRSATTKTRKTTGRSKAKRRRDPQQQRQLVDDRIRELRAEGLTMSAIAAELGYSVSTVRRRLNPGK